MVQHWSIVRKLDPNYKTLNTHLPQAEAKRSSEDRLSLSTQEVSAINKLYQQEGCRNITDTIRSRTQKYALKDRFVFITDCSVIPQGPAEGHMERIVIDKHKNTPHYRLLFVPSINFDNQVVAQSRVIEARFEGGMLKEIFRSGDWKIDRRWKWSKDGFFLSRATITNFSGKKKLDYAYGKYHNYK